MIGVVLENINIWGAEFKDEIYVYDSKIGW